MTDDRPQMSDNCLFIYGSLLTGSGGKRLDRLLAKHGHPVAGGYVRARLYRLEGYPGAVPSSSKAHKVYGRVLRLRNFDNVIRVLDKYEAYTAGNPGRSEFRRARTSVVLIPSGKRLPAWIYFYNRSTKSKPRIATGDYASYRASQASG